MNLLAKTLSGMRWSTLAIVINVSFNLGYTAVMARVLLPSAFGLVAMAQISIRFLSYFAQMGVSPALIQKPELSERDISAALTLSVIVNAALFIALWILAPLAGSFFKNFEVIPILRGLSVALLFSGFSIVSISLMRRQFMFKKIAAVEILSYILGYGVVGIGSALYGLGVWSIVFAVIGQQAITLIGSYAFIRHSLRLVFSWNDMRHFLHYGSKYSIISILEYIGSNVDSVLIGRWYGEIALGFYNRAQMLVTLPMHHIDGAVTKVLLPVLSSAQEDKQKLSRAYLAGWLLLGSLAASISLALVPAASDAVHLLLGPQWKAAIPIVEIAAFGVPFVYLTRLSGTLCDAQGILWPKLIIQCVTLVALGVAIYIFHSDGATGFALSMVIAETLRSTLYVGLHFWYLPLILADFVKVNVAIVLISALSMLSVWEVVHIVHVYAFPIWIRLILEISTGAIVFVFSFCITWLWLRRIQTFISLKNNFPLLDRFDRIYSALIGRSCTA